jgi:hypothetical protein
MIIAPGLLLAARVTLPQLFIVVLAILLLWPLARRLAGSGPKQRRAVVFARMGFVEMPRSQAFGADANALARGIEDRAASFPSTWASKGRSPIGETAIFDYTDETNIGPWPVIAFAVPGNLPEFEITCLQHGLLDCFSQHQPPPAAPAPAGPSDKTMKIGPFKVLAHFDAPLQAVVIEGNEDFANKYTVWATDPAAVRPALKPDLIKRLVEIDDRNLRIKRWRKWLFIHSRRTFRTSPDEYPTLLDEAVQLARAILQ